MELEPLHPGHLCRVLELNAEVAHLTSPLDRRALEQLVGDSDLALVAGHGGNSVGAVLLAYTDATVRPNPNVDWFREHLASFLYIDRVIVGPALRGRGVGRKLYRAAETWARDHALSHLAAEVYIDPPNPASHRFHTALGFHALGDAARGGKRIRHYAKPLAPPAHPP